MAELVLAPAQTLVVAAACLLAAGLCFTVWSSNANAFLQLRVPDAIRGRVLGLYFYASACSPWAGCCSGWLADAGGTALAFAFGGAVTLAATAVAFVKLGQPPHWEARVARKLLYATLIAAFRPRHRLLTSARD